MGAPASSLLIAFRVDSTCQLSSGKTWSIAKWMDLIEEKIFFNESWEMLADSSLANAMRVSLVVGQKGFSNLVQKIMNCLRLLR